MIPVVTQIQGRKSTDDRGSVSFINDFDPTKYGVRRFYVVENHRTGFVRAWHGHTYESKCAYVVRGVVLLAVAPMTECNTPGLPPEGLQKFVLAAWQPQVLAIPAGFFNGFKSLTDDATIVFFSDKTVEESKGDDIRLPWDAFGTEVWEEKYR